MHLGWTTSINAPASLGATRVGADALTYVLPAPIRRINSGSSTPGWQCMFGPSPYIGVLSPEQRPWRRSCHHRSCRSWCWRWNRIWLSHSLGLSQSNAFEATLWVRHLRLCPLGGDGTLCPLGGLRNPLWAPQSWRLIDFGMPSRRCACFRGFISYRRGPTYVAASLRISFASLRAFGLHR